MTDEIAAESSTAEEAPAVNEESTAIQTENTSEEPSTSETSESDTEQSTESGETEASTEDASGSEQNKSGKKGKSAERRIKQLIAKVKSLEERANAPKSEDQPDEKPLNEPSAPKVEEFETWDAYETAQKEFLVKRDEYVADKTRREQVEATQKEQQESEKKRIIADIEKREAKTVQRSPDYDRNEAYSTVRPSQTMDGFFVDSEIGPDILWELHENPDDADKLRELSPWKQVRELVRLEDRLLSQIKGIKKAPAKATPQYVDDNGASPTSETPLWDKLYK